MSGEMFPSGDVCLGAKIQIFKQITTQVQLARLRTGMYA